MVKKYINVHMYIPLYIAVMHCLSHNSLFLLSTQKYIRVCRPHFLLNLFCSNISADLLFFLRIFEIH